MSIRTNEGIVLQQYGAKETVNEDHLCQITIPFKSLAWLHLQDWDGDG